MGTPKHKSREHQHMESSDAKAKIMRAKTTAKKKIKIYTTDGNTEINSDESWSRHSLFAQIGFTIRTKR